MIGVLVRVSFSQLTSGLNELKTVVKALVDKLDGVVTEGAVIRNDIDWLKDLHAEGSSHRREAKRRNDKPDSRQQH